MCILIDTKHKALVDSKTGEKVHPACFDDLIQYHAYLINSRHRGEATQKLKAVFNGEKVISDMVKHAKGEQK